MSDKKVQKALDGSDAKTKDAWSTTEYNVKGIAAGSLDEKGIVMIAESFEESEGKFGTFHILNGKYPDGKVAELLISSAKLTKTIQDHWNDIMEAQKAGMKLHISGEGEKFQREYYVEMV